LQLFKGTIRLKAIVTGSSGDFFNISHLAVPMQALFSVNRQLFNRLTEFVETCRSWRQKLIYHVSRNVATAKSLKMTFALLRIIPSTQLPKRAYKIKRKSAEIPILCQDRPVNDHRRSWRQRWLSKRDNKQNGVKEILSSSVQITKRRRKQKPFDIRINQEAMTRIVQSRFGERLQIIRLEQKNPSTRLGKGNRLFH
jgi:hypothetical protein